MTTSPLTEQTPLVIPDELKPADGRFGCGPSKVRPQALARLAGEGAARDGHLAPPGAGQALVGEIRAGLRELFALPTATRSRSATAARPRSGTRPRSGWCERRALHLAYGEFSRSSPPCTRRRAVPGGPGRDRRRPRRRPDPPASARGGRRRRGRDRVGAQRDLDRGDGRRCVRPRRDAGDALVLIDATSGAGGLPVDVVAGRRLLLRAAEGLRLRRRAVARAAEPRRARADRGSLHASERRWIPRVPVAADRAGELAQGPDLQHAGGRDAVPARRPDRLDARRRRPATGASRARARPPSTCTGGPSSTGTRRRSSPIRPSARWSSARSTSTTRSTRPRSRRRCAPTGSSTSSPTASSGATSCGSGCSRPSTPPTCGR